MQTNEIEGRGTQTTHGEWARGASEAGWKTVEESAAILKAIFPNYPDLDACERYDSTGQRGSELPLPTVA